MKKFILFSLLIMVTSVNCGVPAIDQFKQTLNDAQIKKIEELSEISAQISAKHLNIQEWGKQLGDLFASSEKNVDLEESLNDFGKKLVKALREKKDVTGFFTEGWSRMDNYQFNLAKLFTARLYFEMALMEKLVERYEKCLQELIKIDGVLV